MTRVPTSSWWAMWDRMRPPTQPTICWVAVGGRGWGEGGNEQQREVGRSVAGLQRGAVCH